MSMIDLHQPALRPFGKSTPLLKRRQFAPPIVWMPFEFGGRGVCYLHFSIEPTHCVFPRSPTLGDITQSSLSPRSFIGFRRHPFCL
jgi:hypothetical protein